MRIHCSKCGKPVSNEFEPPQEDLIIRAWVECPECLEKEVKSLCPLMVHVDFDKHTAKFIGECPYKT